MYCRGRALIVKLGFEVGVLKIVPGETAVSRDSEGEARV
jgi:hypothetical protein